MLDFDPDAITRILRETAKECVLPRFRALKNEEILEKTPGDLVTLADVESELRMAPLLEALLPGSFVVGEEGCHKEQERLNLLQEEELLWLVDPVDGTNNFAEGSETFCMMVALLYKKKTIRSWIYSPIDDDIYIAEKGAGSFLNGSQIKVNHQPECPTLLGQSNMAMFSADDRSHVDDLLNRHFGQRKRLRCAGQDFIKQVVGTRHYSLYRRLWPWDHAPGVLLLREAGGKCERVDGRAYDPTCREYGLLASHDAALWDELHNIINPYCLKI